MFDIGLAEFAVLAVAALFIFGPNRLPEVAAKAARGLRQLRQMATNARRDLTEELGPEFENFDVRDLNPRNAIKKYVLEGVDEDDLRVDKDLDLRSDLDQLDKDRSTGRDAARDGSGGSSGPGRSGDQPAVNGGVVADSTADGVADAGSGADAAADQARTKLATKPHVLPPFDPDAT